MAVAVIGGGGADAAPFSASLPLISYRTFACWCLLWSHEFSSSFHLPYLHVSYALPSGFFPRATAPAAIARKTSEMEFFYAIKLMKLLSLIVFCVLVARPDGLPLAHCQLNIQCERDVACTILSPMVSHRYLQFVCVPLSVGGVVGMNSMCNDRNFNLLFAIVFFIIINSSHDVKQFLRIIIFRNKAI